MGLEGMGALGRLGYRCGMAGRCTVAVRTGFTEVFTGVLAGFVLWRVKARIWRMRCWAIR